MKEIRAIVRPNRLSRLRDALRAIPNFPGVTIFKAEGFTALRSGVMDGMFRCNAPWPRVLALAAALNR